MRRTLPIILTLLSLTAALALSTAAHAQDGGTAPAAVPMFRGDPRHTGQMPGPGPTGDARLAWQVELGDGSFRTAPAVVDGVVYAHSGAGTLLALDLATGAERWRAETFDPAVSSAAESSPAVAGELGLVVVAGNTTLFAFDLVSGAERWRVPTGAGGTPVLADGTAYLHVGSALLAFDAATGAQRWRYHGEPFAFGGSVPAVADGAVYVGIGTGVHAVDAATGAVRWFVATEFEVLSSPAVVDGTVYVGTGTLLTDAANAPLLALDAATGAERWRFAGGPFYAAPAVAGGTVYAGGGLQFGEPQAFLYALDAATGAERWRVPSGTMTASVAVVGSVVYTGAEIDRDTWTGAVARAIDAATGTELWRAELRRGLGVEADGFSSPAVVGGMLIVGAGNSRASLYAIGGSS